MIGTNRSSVIIGTRISEIGIGDNQYFKKDQCHAERLLDPSFDLQTKWLLVLVTPTMQNPKTSN
jgi:hypothetical protein